MSVSVSDCLMFLLQLEDKITRHKAHVTSTLDRLAHQVAQEKKERADKCRAFKVRLLFISFSYHKMKYYYLLLFML